MRFHICVSISRLKSDAAESDCFGCIEKWKCEKMYINGINISKIVSLGCKLRKVCHYDKPVLVFE